MLNSGELFPKSNRYVNIYETYGKTVLFDSVSGSIAKVHKNANIILELCDGRSSITDIHNSLNSIYPHLKITEEDLCKFFEMLESKKFITFVQRNKTEDKKVLLINPPFPFEHNRYRTNYYAPPLGLLNIAAVLEEKGYAVRILDMSILDMRPSEITTYLREEKFTPDIIGISANMTFTYPNVSRIALNIKDIYPNIPIILGGNHATFCYQDILASEFSVDYILLYEGERTIVNLCNAILNGEQKLESCAGIAYRNGSGQIVKTKAQERIIDLDEIPFPAYHLVPMELYNPQMRGLIMTSRGCPHNCIYCSTAEFNGRKIAYKSIDRIIDDVKRLVFEYDCKIINFGDDAFSISKDRVLELCKRLEKENLKIRWSCNTRIDMVDMEILEALRSAGCCSVLYGIESINQKVLDTVSKRFRVEQVKNALDMTRKVGIKVKQNYIIGLPYETEQSLEEMRQFIKSTNPDELELCILCLFPGTEIYKNSNKYAITNLGFKWDEYQLMLPGAKTEWLDSSRIMDNYLIGRLMT